MVLLLIRISDVVLMMGEEIYHALFTLKLYLQLSYRINRINKHYFINRNTKENF